MIAWTEFIFDEIFIVMLFLLKIKLSKGKCIKSTAPRHSTNAYLLIKREKKIEGKIFKCSRMEYFCIRCLGCIGLSTRLCEIFHISNFKNGDWLKQRIKKGKLQFSAFDCMRKSPHTHYIQAIEFLYGCTCSVIHTRTQIHWSNLASSQSHCTREEKILTFQTRENWLWAWKMHSNDEIEKKIEKDI